MRRTTLVAAGISALALSAPASATTLGTTSPSVATAGCGTDLVAWESDPGFTVPAGGGVITSIATNASEGGGTMSLKIVRATGNTATVVATTSLFTVAAGANRFPMHVVVNGGEFLGIYSGDGDADCVASGSGTVLTKEPAGGDPPAGASVTATSSVPAEIAVEATFEPDADHDGFGDETEDSCPSDAAIHTGSCVVDLGVTQSVTPTTIGVGDVAVATVTTANGSAGTGTGITLGATVTPGLQIVSTIPGTGCVFAPALSCPLGSLAGGSSSVTALVVKGAATGAQKISSGVATSSTDPNAANNVATTSVKVERRVPLVCTVPKLTGLTKAFAKTLLQAVHCKLGAVKRAKAAKGTKGTVIKQSKKPKKVLRANSKVGVTLKK